MNFMGTNLKHMRDLNASLDLSENLLEGQWMGLLIESVDLTIPTGEIPSMELALNFAGRRRIDLPLGDFVDIGNILMGNPQWDIATDSPNDTLDFGIVIPFCFENAPNALHIVKEGDFSFTYRKGNANGGTVTIAGIRAKNIPENYLPIIAKYSGTGKGRVNVKVPEKNVLYVMVKPRADTDPIYLYKDEAIENDCYGIENQKLSAIVKNIETGKFDQAFFDLAPAKVEGSIMIESLLSDDVNLTVDHGSNDGTSEVTAVSLDFDRSRMQKSQIKVMNEIRDKSRNILSKNPALEGVIFPDRQLTEDLKRRTPYSVR